MYRVHRRIKMAEEKTQRDKKLNQFEQFMLNAKKQFIDSRTFPKIDIGTLNEKQRKVYDIVEKHVENPTKPLRMIVQGPGGTGKSHIIVALRSLFEKAKVKYKIFSFTGSSAFLVGGQTFHSGLRWNPYNAKALPIDNVEHLRRELHGTDFFLVDEVSLCGARLFQYVSLRLSAVFQTEELLGGKNFILFGDIAQLPPVADFPLFKDPSLLDEATGGLIGCESYQTFNRAVVLDQSIRQANSDVFRDLLLNVRAGKLTDSDLALLKTRESTRLSEKEKQNFVRDGLFLFGERAIVKRYNTFRLEDCGEKIIEIPTVYSKNAPEELAEILKLAKGVPVMLTMNVHTASGLHNGAMGKVIRFGPLDNDRIPECVFVKFKSYHGTPYGIFGEVPITRVKRPDHCPLSKTNWTYSQFPLEVSYAVTVHKVQGHTLNKAVIGIPPPDSCRASMFRRMSPSLIYTSMSRCRKLEDLCFSQPFSSNLVRRGPQYHQWIVEEQRLREMEMQMN